MFKYSICFIFSFNSEFSFLCFSNSEKLWLYFLFKSLKDFSNVVDFDFNCCISLDCNSIFSYEGEYSDIDVYVLLRHCNVIDCGINFIRIIPTYSKNLEEFYEIANTSFIWTKDYRIDNKVFGALYKGASEDILEKGCLYLQAEGKLINSSFVSEGDSYVPLILTEYIYDGNHVKSIEGCVFKKCYLDIRSKFINATSFEDCIFPYLARIETNDISLSKFISCKELCISLNGCVDSTIFKDIIIDYNLIEGHGNTDIRNCVFDNVLDKEGKTLFVSYFSYIHASRVNIDNCVFIPEDKSFLPESVRYATNYGLFKKETKTHKIFVTNCKGILNDDEL